MSGRIYCSVFGCMNSSLTHPGITFFTLPGKSERRLQWLQLIRRDDLENKPKYTSYRVCEKHFSSEDFILSTNRKLLKKNALPLFMLPSSTEPGFSRYEDKQTQTSDIIHKRSSVPKAKNVDSDFSNIASGGPIAAAGIDSSGEYSDFDDELAEAGGDHPTNQIEVDETESNHGVCKEETVDLPFSESDRVGFVPATSDNLPEVNMFAVVEHLSNNEEDFAQLDYPKLKLLTKNNPHLITSIQVLQTESTYRVRGTVNFDRMTSHMCEIEYDTHTDTITSSECVCGSNPCEHTAAFVMFLSHKPTNKRTERLQVNKSRECDSRSMSSDDDDVAPSTSTRIQSKTDEVAQPSSKRQRLERGPEFPNIPEPLIAIVPLPKDENEPCKSKIKCTFPRRIIYTLWNNTTGSCPERCKLIKTAFNKQLQDKNYTTDFSPLEQRIEHLCELFDKMKYEINKSGCTVFMNIKEVIELERKAINKTSLVRDPLSV